MALFNKHKYIIQFLKMSPFQGSNEKSSLSYNNVILSELKTRKASMTGTGRGDIFVPILSIDKSFDSHVSFRLTINCCCWERQPESRT